MTAPAHKPTAADAWLQADPTPILRLSENEIQVLADRLFSRGISNVTTYSSRERTDLVAASRTLRALLRAYEHATHRQLQTVILIPEVE